jgi:hypothetical protein
MNKIFTIKDLADLEKYLKKQELKKVRKDLLKQFFKYADYKNISEWNKAVVLCEALAIVGWGDCEPVEAMKGQFYNGSPETEFLNRYRENRFVYTIWAKKGDGYTMKQRRTSYFWSPDIPDKKTVLKDYPVTNPASQNEKFLSQRNWIPKNPILIARYCLSYQPNSEKLVESVYNDLVKLLDKKMRPEKYGNVIDRIMLICTFSGDFSNYVIADESIKTRNSELLYKELLKIYKKSEIEKNHLYLRHRFDYGNFQPKKGLMKVEVMFEKEFENKRFKDQVAHFCKYALMAIENTVERLKKKKLDYNFDLMLEDFKSVLNEWATNAGKSKSNKND